MTNSLHYHPRHAKPAKSKHWRLRLIVATTAALSTLLLAGPALASWHWV
jgi:hypothetical protein